jgi:arylamine N-acetyltransferase
MMNFDQKDRFLALLGVERREPSLNGLRELLRAQMARVPFENISKLYYLQHDDLRDIPNLDTYLDGVERFHFGGTCYSNNPYFHQLLASLGYDAKLCGADMNDPDVHFAIMVRLGGREYLVDTGYAAPFNFPLPRDLTENYELISGEDRYVLSPQDATGRSRLEIFRDDKLRHHYLAKPAARTVADFGKVIRDSFQDYSTFMNSIVLTRFVGDRFVRIHNLTLTVARGEEYERRILADRDELVQAIEELFEIPAQITAGVVEKLGSLVDAWK